MNRGYVKPIAVIFSALILWGGGLLGTSLIPTANAADNLGTIDPSKYSVSISSVGTIPLHLETVPYSNVIRAGEDTVTTTITAPATAAANCKLYLSTDSTTSNALTNGSNTIPATTGTILEPVALTGNSWGFALNNTTPGIAENGFGNSYDAQLPVVDKDSKWAGVPTKGNEVMFQSIPMNQTTTNTNIYYAVSAKDDLAEGTYTGSIVYTAIYEVTDIPTGELTLTPTEGTAGDEITLTSSVVPTMADIGAFDVKLVDPDTRTEYTCENTVTSKTAQGNLQAKCNVPELPEAKAYNVTATYNKNGITYTATDQFSYTMPGPVPCSQSPDVHYLDGLEYFQDFTSTDKDKMTKNTNYKAKDKRDNKEYCFAKLEDGNVWMTENLRLGSSTQAYVLTSTDSNVIDDFTLPAMSTSDSWESTTSKPMLYPSDDIQEDTTKGAVGYYGYYYNHHAAVANTVTGLDAEADICPKGWSLPTYLYSGRGYPELLYSHGVVTDITQDADYADGGYIKITTDPLQFVLSGLHDPRGTGVNQRGSSGYYWSRSADGLVSYAFSLVFNESYIDLGYTVRQQSGAVIRCLAI